VLTRLHHIIIERTDGRALAVLRTIIGALAILKGIDIAIQMADAVGQPRLSWFGSVPDLIIPPSVVVITLVWFTAAIALTIGWRPRIASAALCVIVAGLIAADRTLYNQHLYLLGVVCLVLSLADDVPAGSERRWVARWPLTLLGFQMSAVYGFGALAKLSLDFVTGTVLFAVFAQQPITSLAGGWLLDASVLVPLSILVIAAELVLSIGPWFPRARSTVLAVAGPLHLGMLFLLPLSAGGAMRLAVFGGIQLAILLVAFAPRERVLVVWDDECSFCGTWVTFLHRLDWLQLVSFVPLSEPDQYTDQGISPAAAMDALQLRAADGSVNAGFEAVRRLAYLFPATMLLAPWLALPPTRKVGAWLYGRTALRRRCAVRASAASVISPGD
jgi:predicted DCC family thiol-disulfide oxidoreductase YuxK